MALLQEMHLRPVGPTSNATLVGQLIATAVQQAEALPKLDVNEKELVKALMQCREAFRLTREYVGEGKLPAIEGWAWFDADAKARAALERMGTTTAEALSKPIEGDLAAWAAKAAEVGLSVVEQQAALGREIAKLESREPLRAVLAAGQAVIEGYTEFSGHLAAMPAKPDAGLLKAARRFADDPCGRYSCKNYYPNKEHLCRGCQLRAAIAVAEEAPQRPACAKCGGRPAEHRYRMGDGEWCVCNEGCECDGYVTEEGAEK